MPEGATKLETDGKFGPLTEAAVLEFQSRSGCSGGKVDAGKVDAGTVEALKKPPAATPAPPAATPTTPAPVRETATPQLQTEARRRTLGGEDLARARLEGVTQAQKKGEQFEVLSEENVRQATAQIENVGEGFSQAKAGLAEKRAVVEGEVRALEQKPQRTMPEDALLRGKSAQAQLLLHAEQHLDARKAVFDAAVTAISDGVVTESEANAITTLQGALNKGAEALNAMDQQSSRLVTMAEEAGARVPSSARPAATTPGAPASTPATKPAPATAPATTTATTGPTAPRRLEVHASAAAPPPPGVAQIEKTTRANQRDQMVEGRITVNGNTYDFRSGGHGRGSLPKGEYKVVRHDDQFEKGTNDPLMRMEGFGYTFAMNDKVDPRLERLGDQSPTRKMLRIHPDGGDAGTEGCIGIVGNQAVQQQFRDDMLKEIKENGGSYTLRVQ